MSDVSLGSDFFGYLIFFNIIACFLIGFIPGLYFALLNFTKGKTQFKWKFLISILLSGVCGYISFVLLYNISLLHLTRDNSSIPWVIPPMLVLVEIISITIHFFKSHLNKKKRKKRITTINH